LKQKVYQIALLLLAITILSSSSLLRVSALELPANNSAASVNSSSALRIDTFGSNGLANSVGFSMNDIYAMPKTSVYSDLSCYGRLIESGIWGGVSLQVLLAEAGYTEPKANLQFYASDGYTPSLSTSDYSSQDPIIVAYELEGSPLPETLRLVIPNANGAAWISKITSISINAPIYPISPNPDAAQVKISQPHVQQPTITQTSPTPKPTVQPTPQPTVPHTTNQPAQHPDSLSSNVQNRNLYPIIIGAIAVAAATLTVGYLFVKHRKS
jgi:DMSO/TMAO reductase YedYZ molybdopterin-dependent catalytic subunit